MKERERLRSYLGLCKARISSFAALSAAVGLLLIDAGNWAALPVLAGGVFLLACGACALNHCQERRTDALMDRTAGRPIPSGRIEPVDALLFSLALIGSGSAVLWAAGRWPAPLLGLAALIWYNGFYTWMKARHAFAAVPGALVGAIPPAIGWVAGGGGFDGRLAAVCFFFFMWQVPHFLIHQRLYGREYEAIRLPSLSAVFSGAQIDRLTFQWLLAAAVSLQLIPLQGLIRFPLIQLALLALSLWLSVRGTALIRRLTPSYEGLFRTTNLFMLAAMLLILVERFHLIGWVEGW